MNQIATPLRIRRVTCAEGPFVEDRGESPIPEVLGTLALALPGFEPAPSYLPLRLVPPAQPADPAGPCPALRPLADRLAQAIAEVLAGGRAANQLAGYASHDVVCLLERWAGRFSTAPAIGHSRWSPAARPVVMSLHTCEPTLGVAEVCAVIDTGPRHRALALRLEAPASKWRCTAIQLG